MADEYLDLSTPTLGPPTQAVADAGDEGYAKSLAPRHVGMIAIGGAIGTGLLLGAGGKLLVAGPALALSYAVAGVFAYFVVRALGELTLHRPSSGSFVSYAREFMGEPGAYIAGWMYVLNWSTTGMADSTAVALYMHYWAAFRSVPQWLLALCALIVVLTINLVSVRLFGEIEFWFALIKVTAIASFLVVGVWLLGTGHEVAGRTPGISLIRENGGFFPLGVLPVFTVLQSVVFAYAGVEMVGITAGETKDPAKVVPRAVRSVTWRIALFYVCSVLMLALLLPWNRYSASESPFVTVLSKIGVPGIGGVMNLVVLTAAMSSLNSGFYSTGRVLRSMAAAGSAPRFTGLMNARHVPYGGILFTCAFATFGVGLNAWLPGQAFDIVVNFAALGVATTWIMVMLCHLLFVRRTRAAGPGGPVRPGFRLRGWPWVNAATVLFLLAIVVDMGAQGGATGRWTVAAIPVIAAVLLTGWVLSRRRLPDRSR
ncbi:amino acid permease [Actinospica sp. MGRD01-02]|uniref:Amino acid permease n=1 Tax=Actinospica acidithermotolerans TaxID=2828514 RepID=A0A941E980_9ACTN|nr:amino acid permease [Actinospica acidithermotolerans]MBR7826892.1 amino acid permease [Actinospica acidithermotolerans]